MLHVEGKRLASEVKLKHRVLRSKNQKQKTKKIEGKRAQEFRESEHSL